MSTDEGQTKNKGGRPRKFPGENRTSHTFRIREKNRERLQSEAEANGRSVSEEIEARLEYSFLDESDKDRLIGNIVTQIARGASYIHGEDWTLDKVFASYIYTRICILLASHMGVPVMHPDSRHNINVSVPGFEPDYEMRENMRAAADMAWAEETSGVRKPGFAKLIEQYR